MIYTIKNSQIKVLMLVPSLPPLPVGGSEKQALLLGEALVRKSVSVKFITAGEKNIHGEAEINGMTVYRLNSWLNRIFKNFSGILKKGRPKDGRVEYDDEKEITNQMTTTVSWPSLIYYNIFYFHSLFFLRRKINEFDIIHAHTMEWSAIVAVKLGRALNKPVIIKDSTMNGFQSLARFPQGRQKQKLIAKYAHFIAMTSVIQENLLKDGVTASNITKIPNGIHIAKSINMNKASKDSQIVLFVGNLYQQPAKGVDILLHTWVIVHRSFPHALLQIAGDGLTDGYREIVNRLGIAGTVHFLGRQNDLSGYYADADIFVLPSRREGMSNALMEAMLYELPCVATNISGNQDLITNHINGILVPPSDKKSLAEGIIWMFNHPSESRVYGIRARQTILEQYDIMKIADRYIMLYREMLQTKNQSIL